MKTDVKKLLLLFMSLFVCLGASADDWYLLGGGPDGWEFNASTTPKFEQNGSEYKITLTDYDMWGSTDATNKGFKIVKVTDGNSPEYWGTTATATSNANTKLYTGSSNVVTDKRYCTGTLYWKPNSSELWIPDGALFDKTEPSTVTWSYAFGDSNCTWIDMTEADGVLYFDAKVQSSYTQIWVKDSDGNLYGQTNNTNLAYKSSVTLQKYETQTSNKGIWTDKFDTSKTYRFTWTPSTLNLAAGDPVEAPTDVTVTLDLNGNNYTALWCKCGDEAAKAMTISNGVATLTVPAGYTGISIYDNEACTNLVKTFEKSADNTYTLDVAMTAITLNAAARGWSSAWVHYTYVDASVVTRATLIGATEMTSSGNGTYSAEIPATYTAILFSETKTGAQVTFDVNATGNYVLEEVPAEVWYVGTTNTGNESDWSQMTYDSATGCWTSTINIANESTWKSLKFNTSKSDTNAYGKTVKADGYNLTVGTWYKTTSHNTIVENADKGRWAIWIDPKTGTGDLTIWLDTEHHAVLVGKDYFAYETPKEYGDYYIIGDINGVVDGTGKGWKIDDPAAKDNKWRFYKVNDEDPMVKAGKIDKNWYKLEVPASADGHNALCAQFKITDGQWNSDSNKGHEFTLDFDHGMQELGLSRTDYFLQYIKDNTAPRADQNSKFLYPNGFDAWGRIVELGMNKYTNPSDTDTNDKWIGDPYVFENEDDFNACVTFWSNKLKYPKGTEIDQTVIKDYFDNYRTAAYDATDAVDLTKATDIVSLRGGNKQYTANFHLDTNRITPADRQKSVVIYFLPPTDDVTTDGVTIRRGGKMFIYGKSQRLYFYYFNNEVEKERVKEVRVSVASSTNFNKGYYIDRATSMGNFELVEEPTVGPDGKTYPYYWRKLMTRGYEDRHNQGDSFTAQFTTVIADESGNLKTTLSERKSINCGNVYLMDVTDSYKVRFRYHPAADDTRTIREVRMIVATPTAGDKALAVRSRTEAAAATETTVDNYSWNDSNYYPMDVVDGWYTTSIDSRMGSDYIVFQVTFTGNARATEKEVFYYDPNNRSKWIKMQNTDKDVHIYAAGEDDLSVGDMLFSHLSGGSNTEVQLVIIPAKEDTPYYYYDENKKEILYNVYVSETNSLEWPNTWDNTPYKDINLSSYIGKTVYVYAGVKYSGSDVEHAAVARYTVPETETDNLHIESVEGFKGHSLCGWDECKLPEGTVHNANAENLWHMVAKYDGTMADGTETVNWIKYTSALRQGYDEKQPDGSTKFVEVLGEDEATWQHGDAKSSAHQMLNFGKVLYLVTVEKASTERAAAPAARATGDAIKDFTGRNAVGYAFYASDDHTTGIESVSADTEDAEPVYYNLQGVRIENPAAGHIYIEVRGTAVRKVRL